MTYRIDALRSINSRLSFYLACGACVNAGEDAEVGNVDGAVGAGRKAIWGDKSAWTPHCISSPGGTVGIDVQANHVPRSSEACSEELRNMKKGIATKPAATVIGLKPARPHISFGEKDVGRVGINAINLRLGVHARCEERREGERSNVKIVVRTPAPRKFGTESPMGTRAPPGPNGRRGFGK